MYKITLKVKEKDESNSTVTIELPKTNKRATKKEINTGLALYNLICNTLKNKENE